MVATAAEWLSAAAEEAYFSSYSTTLFPKIVH